MNKLTFEEGIDSPHRDTSQATELAQSHLHEHDWETHDEQHYKVWYQEGT